MLMQSSYRNQRKNWKEWWNYLMIWRLVVGAA
jgi:hypothetical protein